MPTSIYQHQRGALRFYDGAPTSPHFITIPWVQPDPAFPLNRARPEQVLRQNREQFDAYTHFTAGPDSILIEPVEVTFSVWLDNQLKSTVQAALCNPYNVTPWSVGTSVFVSAAGTGQSILNGAGQSVAVPQNLQDPTHRRIHVEFLWYGAPAGTRDFGWRHEECYFPAIAQVVRGGDPVSLTISYRCHGYMGPIEAFTAGTDLTPAII